MFHRFNRFSPESSGLMLNIGLAELPGEDGEGGEDRGEEDRDEEEEDEDMLR